MVFQDQKIAVPPNTVVQVGPAQVSQDSQTVAYLMWDGNRMMLDPEFHWTVSPPAQDTIEGIDPSLIPPNDPRLIR